ncbi:hypothetical protein ACRAWD_25880 [Caulobacter segnis]
MTAADRRELRYGLALLAVLIALAARTTAVLVTDVPLNFPTFFVAVLVSAMVGGPGPGLLAVGLSAGVAWRLWMSTDGSWLPHTRERAAGHVRAVRRTDRRAGRGAMRVVAVRRGLAAQERFRSVQGGVAGRFRDPGARARRRQGHRFPAGPTPIRWPTRCGRRGRPVWWGGGCWRCFRTRRAATWSSA